MTTFFRGFFFFPKLPKMCVFGKKSRKPFQKNAFDSRYWRFDTRYNSRLWKRLETRLTRCSTIEILSPGWVVDGHNHLYHMIRGIINSIRNQPSHDHDQIITIIILNMIKERLTQRLAVGRSWERAACWAPPGRQIDEENRMLRSFLYTYGLTLGFVSWLACPIFRTEKQIEMQLTRAARQWNSSHM